MQAQASLREERCSWGALQQQLTQVQEAGGASAQSVVRLEAQVAQLATQLQHSQSTSHTLQKLIQVTLTHVHQLIGSLWSSLHLYVILQEPSQSCLQRQDQSHSQ